MKKLILFFCTVLYSIFTYAQEQAATTINARIIDSVTKAPLAYCNVIVESAKTGTVSNEDGEFVLHLPAAHANDKLRISRIGYTTDLVSIAALSGKKAVIALAPKENMLSEVKVRPVDPAELVKKAFERISVNYSQRPLRMQGFYREYILEDDRTVELSEALLGIYLSPYSGRRSEVQLKLVKGRKSSDSSVSRSGKYMYIGGVPHALLEADAVHEVNEFDRDEFLRYSDMQLTGIKEYDGMQVYEIAFDQKDNLKKALYKGRLFIDTESLAIVSMDYGFSPKGIQYFRLLKGAAKMTASLAKIDIDLLDQHFTINYKKVDSTWFLNDAVASYDFHFVKKGEGDKHIDVKLHVGSELLVNGIDENVGMPFTKSEQLQYKGPFSKKITDYDPLFWMGNNYIAPSAKIRSIAEKLKDVK